MLLFCCFVVCGDTDSKHSVLYLPSVFYLYCCLATLANPGMCRPGSPHESDWGILGLCHQQQLRSAILNVSFVEGAPVFAEMGVCAMAE